MLILVVLPLIEMFEEFLFWIDLELISYFESFYSWQILILLTLLSGPKTSLSHISIILG